MSRELILSGHIFNKQSGSATITNNPDSTTMTGYVWGSHTGLPEYQTGGYIEINPSGHTYQYDIVFSNTSGSQLYIGFERYDAAKTSTSNNSCVYIYSGTQGRDKYRIKGTVNLATDSTGSPTKYIKLRLLNNWNNDSGNPTSVFYHISLREVDTLTQFNVNKKGIAEGDLYREDGTVGEVGKNGINQISQIKEV